jgi:hypothetical protein
LGGLKAIKDTGGEARLLFRRVFLSEDGLRVLRILLKDWCFFDACTTRADRAMNEYAKRFIEKRLGLADLYPATDLVLDESIRVNAEKGDNYGTET